MLFSRNIVRMLLFLCLAITLLSEGNIYLEFDYAQFKYDSTSNAVEFYLLVDKDKSMQSKELALEVKIDKNDTLVVNKLYQLGQDSDSPDENAAISLLKFAIPFGEYGISISVKDKSDSVVYKSLNDSLRVINFYTKPVDVSGIQLASNIITDSEKENSIFYKNGMEVVPNPADYYDNEPIMFYYTELYSNGVNKGNVTLERTVFDVNGKTFDQKKRELSSFQNDVVDFDVINITKFPSGEYTLLLTLIDTTNNSYSRSIKKFYVANQTFDDKAASSTNEDFLSSEFATMSNENCDNEFMAIMYFINEVQKKTYESYSSVESKRKFLYDFWNTNSLTATSENRVEHLKRVKYARKNFGSFSKDGVKSDRGRVYLLYGPPDDVERNASQMDSKPFEVWTYNSIEDGVEFIFADLTGYGDYELVHSTKRGEISNQEWENRI